MSALFGFKEGGFVAGLLGILLFSLAVVIADRIAVFLLRRPYSRGLSVTARKLYGIAGVVIGGGGALIAGIAESSWLPVFPFVLVVAVCYAGRANENE